MVRNRNVSVMDYNVYLGANLNLILQTTRAQLPPLATELLQQFLANNFPLRARSIAQEIKKTSPDLIGLQEMSRVELIPFIGTSAPRVTYDFLTILLRALRQQGLNYRPIAVGNNFSGRSLSTTGYLIRTLDRNVILARVNAPFTYSNVQNNTFSTNLVTTVGGQRTVVNLGWSSVDVRAYGTVFRFVNTRLQSSAAAAPIRMAQATQLIQSLNRRAIPTILVGDFKSDANINAPTYRQFLQAGYTDAWRVGGRGVGNTCCQNFNLLNTQSTLSQRVDYILYRPRRRLNLLGIGRVGISQRSRTPPLWPSLYAGLVARFRLTP
ncbi:endonuclease/exonuclease/phosphatase family protein [Marininema halotolerans]|uniref:Metal-dependent hydrolase, endonuclease/exonuclease/phosphatase family n=1 Tax=Marininema halotolerans TaxID=1155944 RepID=A0A1I6P5Z3_9BACL|nr:endonuclease/exonuclease/phosphatase family protein [Marininema halotolerans]SFS35561.1 Metal-dependent hydrolase, endonuclease/exonuclease/phosphatase family [Marininema halotolerans]